MTQSHTHKSLRREPGEPLDRQAVASETLPWTWVSPHFGLVFSALESVPNKTSSSTRAPSQQESRAGSCRAPEAQTESPTAARAVGSLRVLCRTLK